MKKFSEFFTSKKPILSLEFFPPKRADLLERTFDRIRQLKELNPSFMTVTYGAGGGTRELTQRMVSYIHGALEVPAVAHLTCVGHTQAEINGVLDGLKEVGINNILALRGDPPKGETTFTPPKNGFSNAKELTSFVAGRGDFSIAVAGYPETHLEAKSPEDDIRYLKTKVDAGAEVIITQLFFDPEMYLRFRDRCDKAGIKVPILPGIMPISDVNQVKRFTAMCGASIPERISNDLARYESGDSDILEYGTKEAISLCTKLLQEGAPGVHIYTLNKSNQTEPIVLGLKGAGLL